MLTKSFRTGSESKPVLEELTIGAWSMARSKDGLTSEVREF